LSTARSGWQRVLKQGLTAVTLGTDGRGSGLYPGHPLTRSTWPSHPHHDRGAAWPSLLPFNSASVTIALEARDRRRQCAGVARRTTRRAVRQSYYYHY
jgi:hypothetical protein